MTVQRVSMIHAGYGISELSIFVATMEFMVDDHIIWIAAPPQFLLLKHIKSVTMVTCHSYSVRFFTWNVEKDTNTETRIDEKVWGGAAIHII